MVKVMKIKKKNNYVTVKIIDIAVFLV